MLKITSTYKPDKKYLELGEELESGDKVYCRASSGSASFYGMYIRGVGIVDLEYGSIAYMPSKEPIYLKQQINYWTVEKRFKNVEIVIKDDLVEKVSD